MPGAAASPLPVACPPAHHAYMKA